MNQKDRDLFYRQTSERDHFNETAASYPRQEAEAQGSGILGRRARIAFLNDSARIAGAESSLKLLLRNLDARLFNVSVICPKNGPLVTELQEIGVHVIPLKITDYGAFHRPLDYLPSLLRVYWAVRRLNVDIIHCNSSQAAHWGIPLGQWLGKSVVCQVRSFRHTPFTTLIFRQAKPGTVFVAISEAVRAGLRRTGVPDENIRLIYGGVDVGAYSSPVYPPITDGEFQFRKEEFKIGIIGRIESWKRHIDAIEALAGVVPEIDARLFVIGEAAGDIELEAHLRARVWELGLEDRIVFTGQRRDTSRFLSALDVVVLPFIDEPFGKTTIEAMAAGKPVIAADSGCIPEIIQSGVNGLLVPAKSPQAIAACLRKLFRDPDYARKIGRNARQKVLENFTMETYVRHIQRLYMEAVPAIFGRP
jgi:glycosyltransferase involved in cell wall biosynthesis